MDSYQESSTRMSRSASASTTFSMQETVTTETTKMKYDELKTQAALIVAPEDCASDALLNQAMRRQAEWDRQLESVDQKQAELASVQWRLVRDQNCTLARELAAVQHHLKDLQLDSRRAILEVERMFRESESKITEERHLRTAMCEGMEQHLRRVRRDVEEEGKRRVAGAAELEPKLEAFAAQFTKRFDEQASVALEMRQLRDMYTNVVQDVACVRDAVVQEARERRSSEENLAASIREMRDALEKESRERAVIAAELHQSVRSAIDRERSERHESHTTLCSHFASLQQDIQPHKDELPAIRSRMSEVECMLVSRLADHQKNFEAGLGEHSAGHARLEKRLADLTVSLEKEMEARSALAEETDQMLRTHRTKLRNLVSDQAEAARVAGERLQGTVMEHLEKESRTRQAHNEVLHGQLASHRHALDVKMENVEAAIRGVEESQLGSRAEAREWEASQQKFSEEFTRQLRDVRDWLQARLEQEVAAREAQGFSLEQHVDFLGSFLGEVRELFVQKGSWQRRRVSTVSRVSTTGSAHHRESISSPATSRQNREPVATSIRPLHSGSSGAVADSVPSDLQPFFHTWSVMAKQKIVAGGGPVPPGVGGA